MKRYIWRLIYKLRLDKIEVINHLLYLYQKACVRKNFKSINGVKQNGVLLINPDAQSQKWLGWYALYIDHILNGCMLAEILGLKPYISLDKDCLYYDASYGDNPFEYFYLQDGLDKKEIAAFASENQSNFVYGMNKAYTYNVHNFKRLGKIQQKYIHLKENVQAGIEEDIVALLGKEKKNLAVHIRGTDFKKEFEGHPAYLQESCYFDEIDKAIAKYGYEQIFLATDDQSIMDRMKEKYRGRVVSYKDAVRSRDGVALHFSNVEESGYKGQILLDVIRDVKTIAHCDGFISGLSNVSFGARIEKFSQNRMFELDVIIEAPKANEAAQ